MAKKLYESENQAQAAKDTAVRFARDALDDPDKAEAIEEESLDEWLTRTRRRIKNKYSQERRLIMARKTAAEYAAEIRSIKEERDELAAENEELNDLLDEIGSLTSSDEDEDEDE